MKNDIIALLALYGGYRIIKDICIYFYHKNYYTKDTSQKRYDRTQLKEYGKVVEFRKKK